MSKRRTKFKGVDKIILEWNRQQMDTTKCEKCGKIFKCDNEYDIHHIKKYCDRPDLVLELSNLQVLCKECHKKIHEKEKYQKRNRKKRKKKKKDSSKESN